MNYVLATSRPWNEVLAKRLEQKTGHKFYLITSKSELTHERLQEFSPRYVFFPHWSYRIPQEIHDAYECVIFHMTDLPYGRGGSPLQNLIQRGHAETKISALRCVAEVDAGPIYMKRPLSLEGAASEIFLRAAGEIEYMIEAIVRNEPAPEPQRGDVVTFERRKPAESNLADARMADLNDFFDFIRMLDSDGYPKAFIELHGHRIELSEVHAGDGELMGTFKLYRQTVLPDSAGGGLND